MHLKQDKAGNKEAESKHHQCSNVDPIGIILSCFNLVAEQNTYSSCRYIRMVTIYYCYLEICLQVGLELALSVHVWDYMNAALTNAWIILPSLYLSPCTTPLNPQYILFGLPLKKKNSLAGVFACRHILAINSIPPCLHSYTYNNIIAYIHTHLSFCSPGQWVIIDIKSEFLIVGCMF